MKKILISGAGGDVAAGITKCILSEMPRAVLFSCDIKPIVPFLDRFEKHFVVPRYDSADYISAIKTICFDFGITHFFPTTEPEILIANKQRDFFEENGILLLINNERILDIATSKYKTAAFLKENNVDVPDTYRFDEPLPAFEYPLIVKPDFGRGSADLIKVNNQTELKDACIKVSFPVIQKYVGTDEQEFTVGVFSDGVRVRSISYRRTLGRGNMSVFVEVVDDPALNNIAQDIALLFGLRGALNIQLRLEAGKYYVFEINPRVSSTVAFRHQMGFQDVIWWIQLLSGEPISDYAKVEVGTIGIKVDSEHIFNPPFDVVEI